MNNAEDWQAARQQFVSKDTSTIIKATFVEKMCSPDSVQNAFNQNIKSIIVVDGIDAAPYYAECFKYVPLTKRPEWDLL